jgi:hypothetical protein
MKVYRFAGDVQARAGTECRLKDQVLCDDPVDLARKTPGRVL